jgi:ATP-dependent protease HslVU (ClpYQ) peptidase subunit
MRQIKTPIAGNSQSIAKIGNAELAHFNKQMLIHELIRGSLMEPAGATAEKLSLLPHLRIKLFEINGNE